MYHVTTSRAVYYSSRIRSTMLGLFSLLISLGGLSAVGAQSVQVFGLFSSVNEHKGDLAVSLER